MVRGRRAAGGSWKHLGQNLHTHTGTMDTKPKILMPKVVAYWKLREGCAVVCVWGVPTDYPHTPAASQEGGCQRISDPRLSSFSPCCHPCCYYVCILVIHTGSLTLLAQVNTYTHRHTSAGTHHFTTPVEHGCQAEKERDVFIHFLLCMDRVLVQWIGKGAPDNEASVITELLQPLTTSIHWDQIKAFNCFASY